MHIARMVQSLGVSILYTADTQPLALISRKLHTWPVYNMCSNQHTAYALGPVNLKAQYQYHDDGGFAFHAAKLVFQD